MTMRILVAQTTRMGDMVQTSPLVHAVRYKHPDAHIVALVRRMGRVIAERHPDVDEVLVYDEDEMFYEMRSGDSDRFLRAYKNADQILQTLRERRFDRAYNVTHSIASAMLMKLAEIPDVAGAHLSADWRFVLRGPWANYFFTSVFHREYNDLNLCDITRHFVEDAPPARLTFEVRDEDRAFVRELLAEHGVGADDFVACFQLGASENSKRWSERHFAELGRLLRKRNGARIFLVGVKEEAAFGEAFEAHAPGVAVSLFGKTSIPQVAALLERSRLLVSNDTGTMHVAAAVGCPVVLVSVGYVHFRETGPYGEGHCAIEWRRARLGRADSVQEAEEERALIQPEQVYGAVEAVLAAQRGGTGQLRATPDMAPVDLYMSRFAPDQCLQWYPVLRRPLTERDFLRTVYRAMWLDYLGGQRNPETERESLLLLLGHFDDPEEGAVEGWGESFGAVFQDLAQMAEKGVQQTQRLLECLGRPRGAARAREIVRDLMALDEEMRLFAELHPACKPLALIARFERDNLEGSDPRVLAQVTLEIYRACVARARLFREKAERTARLWPFRTAPADNAQAPNPGPRAVDP